MITLGRSILVCALAMTTAQCPSSRTAAALGAREVGGEPLPVRSEAGALAEDEDDYGDDADDEDGELLWNPVEVAMANHRAWLAERAGLVPTPLPLRRRGLLEYPTAFVSTPAGKYDHGTLEGSEGREDMGKGDGPKRLL
jgi:hypothetical protein